MKSWCELNELPPALAHKMVAAHLWRPREIGWLKPQEIDELLEGVGCSTEGERRFRALAQAFFQAASDPEQTWIELDPLSDPIERAAEDHDPIERPWNLLVVEDPARGREIPKGGYEDDDNNPTACALRELREETTVDLDGRGKRKHFWMTTRGRRTDPATLFSRGDSGWLVVRVDLGEEDLGSGELRPHFVDAGDPQLDHGQQRELWPTVLWPTVRQMLHELDV